ncbi:MAG: hypothetical protein HZA27_04460 [Candidatus Omnitrophica bacterium]|nr:hypothetical protein [Candidatus Omnitrophota bacterium]
MDTYLRTDVVSFKNVTDLDSANSDDTTTYLGIDYHLGFKVAPKNNGPTFYLMLERNGPSDYSAPLFVQNTPKTSGRVVGPMTSGGIVGKYHNDKLLPQVEEFWLDTPLGNNSGFKIGLYTYEVGSGISLNGSFENYGFTLYQEWQDLIWRLYYCRPDIVYKNPLGPNIVQDKEQGFEYNHNASNFFATDVKFNIDKICLNPYIGALADYTSSGKRDNVFTTPIKRDILGTFGISLDLKEDKLSSTIELAHNFGKAKSANAEYKDVYHTGYFAYSKIDYKIKEFIPYFQFLLCSGNKVKPEMAQDQDSTLTSGKNRAFSYTSPLNKNLGDSISGGVNAAARPVVAMGSGYGLNYGVPRPGTFASADFDNLLIPSLGFIWELAKEVPFGLDLYYIRSFTKPVGTLDGQGKYLSPELGYEIDLSLDYKFNKNVLISFLGGYFLPGKYYKEKRDDTSASLLSPFLRGDGGADSAYQLEFSVEFQF